MFQHSEGQVTGAQPWLHDKCPPLVGGLKTTGAWAPTPEKQISLVWVPPPLCGTLLSTFEEKARWRSPVLGHRQSSQPAQGRTR